MTAVQALVLPVGSDLYALPVDWVREVVATPALTPLVTAPAMVLGLFNLRGQIVPLLDSAALLGIGLVQAAKFAVVVNCPEGPIGLAVTDFPQRGVLDTPVGPSELPGTSGLYRLDQRVAALLDPAVLLTAERITGPELRIDSPTVGAG